jgi:hypothetical protein
VVIQGYGVRREALGDWTTQGAVTSSKTFEESKGALKSLIEGRSTTLIIDALDECSNPGSFLAVLEDFAGSSLEHASVRIFISSREGIAVDSYLSTFGWFSLEITPERVHNDLNNFVKGFIENQCTKQHHKLGEHSHSALRADLEKVLVDRSGAWYAPASFTCLLCAVADHSSVSGGVSFNSVSSSSRRVKHSTCQTGEF